MRDSKGCFIRGHKALNPQDKTTGRFVSKSQDAPEYELKPKEITEFLKNLESKTEG